MIANIYSRIFSRGFFSKINNRILLLALRARGYNNFRNNSESGESFFIEKILSPTNPRLCIDIGANVGDYTVELLSKTNASIVSFEPLPTAFQKLTEATKNAQERVTLENKGVGKAADVLTIHYNPNALAHASFSEEVKKVSYVSNDEQVDVPVVTLDAYCEENNITEIDFVKIDTEGFESEVFEGAKHTFAVIKPKFIQIEFNWHQLFRNISLNFFAEKLPDYDVYQLIPNGWIKRDAKDPLTNIYHFSNFIFVRKT
ncbi:FkbM family methyltransferase [Vibrio gazogenes]|uniref:Methyltransferase, FkbM family n=1 Tax=Vibrio gazogenes DSM 21264 = NBRC 103151 TaxID=1123492 RepID=A0A1M5G461_VIBGA|nr:FkbM family methyltransferase [Vibrio gazogenes]USP14410.1 FkbM family methyltransferase [Vibrio gazogenes]SHF98590.1 methyltransferase, FkbM family [Vibrio gazogenes DSM 21264] [Vibrio gazogenes DSM 21264 = NBRC 103151]SJN58742.1 2-O-methyltransferase NoeI [Vibrio gazogenes]